MLLQILLYCRISPGFAAQVVSHTNVEMRACGSTNIMILVPRPRHAYLGLGRDSAHGKYYSTQRGGALENSGGMVGWGTQLKLKGAQSGTQVNSERNSGELRQELRRTQRGTQGGSERNSGELREELRGTQEGPRNS